MDLTQLRYFRAIVQSGSMTAAARALRVSQPTLTVAVKNLEEELRTTLLLRNRSGVTPTTTGHELVRVAHEVFDLLDRAEHSIQGLEAEEVGRFVIGCHESLGAYFLPGFLKGFLRDVPKIEVALWNGTSDAVREAVVARAVDFGLVVNPRPHPELVLVELFRDAVDIFVAAHLLAEALAAHPEPASRRLRAAHSLLKAGPLVFAGRVEQCQVLIDKLSADHLLPDRLLSCGDLELTKSLALAGVGVALLPRRVAAYGQRGRLVRAHADLPSFEDRICLVFRADIHKTKASVRLKEALIAYGRHLDAEAEDSGEPLDGA